VRNTDTSKANEVRIRKAAQRRNEIKQIIDEFRREYGDLSLRNMADLLNDAGYRTPRGKQWSHVQVKRVLAA